MNTASAESLAYIKRVGLPIVALATAPGGPVSIIRISGRDLKFIEKLSGAFPKESEYRFSKFHSKDGALIDEGLILYFKGPRSFTGEDVVELQVHGVSSTLKALEDEIISLGALKALPGEFSFRAVFNNKMSLEKAEALQGAFSSEALGASAAAKLLAMDSGNLASTTKRLEALLEGLWSARARVEAAIDFSEAEEEQSKEIDGAKEFLKRVDEEFTHFINSYESFSLSAKGPTLAILGEPNVGKSTLLNILCGGERAIVSNLAGTTRDLIEIKLKLLNGTTLRVLDTAGIRSLPDDESPSSQVYVEALGIEKSIRAAEDAQIILFVQKANTSLDSMLLDLLKSHHDKCIEIYSHRTKKTDLENEFDFLREENQVRNFVFKKIEDKIEQLQSLQKESSFFVSKRQYGLILSAREDLDAAFLGLEGLAPLELVGNHLRDAEEKIRKSIGQGVGEEYISQIFSQFCLGK